MLAVLRWAGLVAGALLVVWTIGSVIGTIVVPRGVRSRISGVSWHSVRRVFLALVRRLGTYEAQDRVLALLGPVSLLVLLLTWLLLLLIGFGLTFWPLSGGGLLAALRLAGSSLLTLGFAVPEGTAPHVLVFVAAAVGLVVVALQLGYLPTIYSAYNRRETLVNMLESRAGEPVWGPELLAREQLIGSLATMPALFSDWEHWVADLAETHSNYPWLLHFRSSHPLRSWLVSLLAMLDAAALYLALAPGRAPPEARHMLRTGFTGLRAIAHAARVPVNKDPRPDDPLVLTFEEFAEAVEHVRRVGFPIERETAEAWPHFHGWRVNYEAVAYQLADNLVAVPAPWSGRRQLTAGRSIQIRRPLHRTPEDPEGRNARVTPAGRDFSPERGAGAGQPGAHPLRARLAGRARQRRPW
ncbi:MAG TPA: hypothetical protein VKG45_06800 [Actinomycetes bacterium]|nr:hypothetical protein [Actinomycetes bacterium]